MEVFCVDISGVVLAIPRRISYTPVETVAPTCALPLVASHALIEIEVGVDSTGSKVVFYLGDQEGNRFYLEMPRDAARELGMSMMADAVGPPDMEVGQIGYEAYRLEAEGRPLSRHRRRASEMGSHIAAHPDRLRPCGRRHSQPVCSEGKQNSMKPPMPTPTPMPPAEAREQLLKARVEVFGTKLYNEWEPKMMDEVAAAANATEGVAGEDLRRLGPFINQMVLRIFCLGVAAAIKAYPEFLGGVMAPPTRQELGTIPNA